MADKIVRTLPDPPGGITARRGLGARIEVPYTRAIVSRWREATLTEGTWTVALDSPLESGLFNWVWRTGDPEASPERPSRSPWPHWEHPEYEMFLPLLVDGDGAAGGDWGSGGGLWPALGFSFPEVDVSEVRPTVEEVALQERRRTVDEMGNRIEVFGESSPPTFSDVDGVIDQSVEVVLAALPTRFHPRWYPTARRVIVFYAAMTIEGSWFREQATGNSLPWQNEYQTSLRALNDALTAERKQNNLLGAMEPRGTPYAKAGRWLG